MHSDSDENKRESEISRDSVLIDNSITSAESFENLEIQSYKSEKNQMLNDDIILDSKEKFIFYKKIGNIFSFLYFKGEPLVVIGPHC